MKELETNGFFINKDGVNSNTIAPMLVKQKKGEAVQAVTASKQAAPKSTVLQPKRASVSFMFFVKTKSKEVMIEHKCNNVSGAISILGKQW